MTPEQARAQIAMATDSRKAEREANEAILQSSLDAADRIIMRKAADTVLEVAKAIGTDPTL